MRAFYLGKISYRGDAYFGWQAQHKDTELERFPSVQGVIQNVLYRLFRQKNCYCTGVSRTDKGVHARCQIVKIAVPAFKEPESIKAFLKSNLPDDIQVHEIKSIPEEFDLTKIAKSKTYHYYFSYGSWSERPQSSISTMHIFEEQLNIQEMQKAAQLLIGEHDFKNLALPSYGTLSSTRKVLSSEIEKIDEKIFCFKISGNGFLKQMIRQVMAYLILVGKDQWSPEDFKLLLNPDRPKQEIKSVAPNGLHLWEIEINCEKLPACP